MAGAFKFNNTLGAMFIGYTLEVILYGLTALQTFLYYRRTSHDRPFLHYLVGVLFVLDTLHVAFTAHALYWYMVVNYTHPFALLAPVWSLGALTMVTAISDLFIRFVFGHRVWKLSRNNWWLATVVAACSLFSFATAVFVGVKSLTLDSFFQLVHFKSIIVAALAASVATDAILAGSLCLILSFKRSGFQRMDSLVNVLIVYGISTGALTVLCASVVLITYLTMPDNFIWLGAFFVIGKLFLNSLLVSLNARRAWVDQGAVPLANLSSAKARMTARNDQGISPTAESQLAVKIETITQTHHDVPWDGYAQSVVVIP